MNNIYIIKAKINRFVSRIIYLNDNRVEIFQDQRYFDA